MKLKILLLFVASVSSVVVVACSEVVFPTPLPTATPAPTATPIVFPTPLPTATPMSIPSPPPTATPSAIIFPTPLPTATPIVFPTPLPTATPFSIPSPLPTATPSALVFPTPLPTATPVSLPSPVVFPTALPTATPAPTATPVPTATPISIVTRYKANAPAFAGINTVKLQPLHGGLRRGSGFAFSSQSDKCTGRVCILTAHHVVGSPGIGNFVNDASEPSATLANRLAETPNHSDAGLDIAVVRVRDDTSAGRRVKDLTRFEFAPRSADVLVGDPVRVVSFDLYESGRWIAAQMVLSGVVSNIREDDVEFMIDASLIRGNSGGVVLNARMEVIGMVRERLNIQGEPGLRSRNVIVHVDAIRDKLCEWGYLVGSDCR